MSDHAPDVLLWELKTLVLMNLARVERRRPRFQNHLLMGCIGSRLLLANQSQSHNQRRKTITKCMTRSLGRLSLRIYLSVRVLNRHLNFRHIFIKGWIMLPDSFSLSLIFGRVSELFLSNKLFKFKVVCLKKNKKCRQSIWYLQTSYLKKSQSKTCELSQM